MAQTYCYFSVLCEIDLAGDMCGKALQRVAKRGGLTLRLHLSIMPPAIIQLTLILMSVG